MKFKVKSSGKGFSIAFLAIVAVCLLYVILQFGLFVFVPLKLTKAENFLVPDGATVTDIAWNLKRKHFIDKPNLFIVWAKLLRKQGGIKAGEYLLSVGITQPQLLTKLVKGDMLYRAFTVVEGWDFQQLLNSLASNKAIKHTLKGLTPKQIMQRIGHAGEDPEGRFYPETYLFSVGTKDSQVLQKAYNFTQQKLDLAWKNRADNLPYKCEYEALIVASLVEKEGAVEEELPRIAGVIVKRLKIGMPLQIDATVIYGLGKDYKGKLSKADMVKKTPYNTYLMRGLPPTPIAMPGPLAIKASMHPVIGKDLYYVAKGDGSGEHKFSATLKEQQAAVKKYILKKNGLKKFDRLTG